MLHFISDLHLSEKTPKTAKRFLHFLESFLQTGDSLYILGDLFEVWIGDDDLTPFHSMIINALKSASDRGIVISIMRGNRDFLMGRRFFRLTKTRFLKDPSVIQIGNQRLLLTHGDLLCTKDKPYLRFRKKVQNPLVKAFFLSKSLKSRRKIASNYRKQSKKEHQKKSPEMMDVTFDAILKFLKIYRTDYLIHGHIHKPASETISHRKVSKRFSLANWDERHANSLNAYVTTQGELIWSLCDLA